MGIQGLATLQVFTSSVKGSYPGWGIVWSTSWRRWAFLWSTKKSFQVRKKIEYTTRIFFPGWGKNERICFYLFTVQSVFRPPALIPLHRPPALIPLHRPPALIPLHSCSLQRPCTGRVGLLPHGSAIKFTLVTRIMTGAFGYSVEKPSVFLTSRLTGMSQILLDPSVSYSYSSWPCVSMGKFCFALLRGAEKTGCKICSGAPTVSQTTGWIR